MLLWMSFGNLFELWFGYMVIFFVFGEIFFVGGMGSGSVEVYDLVMGFL